MAASIVLPDGAFAIVNQGVISAPPQWLERLRILASVALFDSEQRFTNYDAALAEYLAQKTGGQVERADPPQRDPRADGFCTDQPEE